MSKYTMDIVEAIRENERVTVVEEVDEFIYFLFGNYNGQEIYCTLEILSEQKVRINCRLMPNWAVYDVFGRCSVWNDFNNCVFPGILSQIMATGRKETYVNHPDIIEMQGKQAEDVWYHTFVEVPRQIWFRKSD